jgi:pyridoxal phosphate enzyme (YggS family)
MNSRNDQIRENIHNIRARIALAAARSGRSAADISLMAVTKNVPTEEIRMALEAGITHIGESKIQEAKQKFLQLGPAIKWSMLGHLQTNKARNAAAIFDLIQSVDSERLANVLERETQALDRQLDVLVEVNIGGEDQKFGVPLSAAMDLLRAVEACPHLRLRGLMAMAPVVPDAEMVRPFFKELAQFYRAARQEVKSPERWSVLSMGMTSDFEVAVEEGATLVRVGTGIFSNPSLFGRYA